MNKKLLPAVKSAMNPSMKKVYDTEILKIIKQLHKAGGKCGRKRRREGCYNIINDNTSLPGEIKYDIYKIASPNCNYNNS